MYISALLISSSTLFFFHSYLLFMGILSYNFTLVRLVLFLHRPEKNDNVVAVVTQSHIYVTV